MAVDMEQQPLRVTIIGAGIAGLTAALALRKQGHVVTVSPNSHRSRTITHVRLGARKISIRCRDRCCHAYGTKCHSTLGKDGYSP